MFFSFPSQLVLLIPFSTQEGFTETPSGLQYKVLLDGDGPIPTTGQRIKADYTGAFRSSRQLVVF